MLKQFISKGIGLGLALFLATFAGQALAASFSYTGVATLCTGTCDGFAALGLDATLDGGVAIDVEANGSFTFDDVGDYGFLVTNPAAPLEDAVFDGSGNLLNPTTANPLPVDTAVSVLEPQNTSGSFVTGGTADSDGQLASGTLLFRFTVPPFSSNDAWVTIDIGTGTAQVCLFFDTAGCVTGATEAVIITGAFALGPSLEAYNQDFEALDKEDPDALANDDWTVFGNVFDSDENFKFGYGPFDAPNGGPAFSAIVDDQGGATQGTQQLSIYNDYDCCQPDQGHFNGTDLVESNVFQEQMVGFDNIGETWEFSFDAKLGDLAGATTALAFIKTLDPNAGFALTNFVTVDMTSIPATWNRYSISLTIDAGLVGQILQIGYASTASAFEASQVVYDNIVFGLPDADGDGVLDSVDNCTLAANAGQEDTDVDGHGNICDADFNNTCGSVNFLDLQIMQGGFFTINPLLDLNSSGGPVNFVDLQIMQGLFFALPGPSAPGALCN